MTTTTKTYETIEYTVDGQTREITLEVHNDRHGYVPFGTFVGRIGAGRATYEAQVTFRKLGGRWRIGTVVIRNRAGVVTGWGDTAIVTNDTNNRRVA